MTAYWRTRSAACSLAMLACGGDEGARAGAPTVSLAALAKPGFEVTLDPGVVRGGRAFVPVQYTNFAPPALYRGLVVAVLDVASDALVGVLEDARCYGTQGGLSLAEDGTIYAVYDNYLHLAPALDPAAPDTRVVRIAPGEERFDPAFEVALPGLTGGRQGAGLLYAGGGKGYVLALDPAALGGASPADDYLGFLGARVAMVGDRSRRAHGRRGGRAAPGGQRRERQRPRRRARPGAAARGLPGGRQPVRRAAPRRLGGAALSVSRAWSPLALALIISFGNFLIFSSRSSRMIRKVMCLFLGAALAAVGCGGDDDGGLGGDGGGAGGPRYMLGIRSITGDDTLMYMTPVGGLGAGEVADTGRAIEVSGYAGLHGEPGVGWFAVGASEQPTLTRYDLDATGGLVAGPTLSFADTGVADVSAWENTVFVSPTKAYYLDGASAQIVVWNPQAMALERTIALALPVRPGVTNLSGVVRRDGQVFFTVGWNNDDYTQVLPGVHLVAVDVATDAVTVGPSDERCGYGYAVPARAENGDIYYFSGNVTAVGALLFGSPVKECALRVRAGETGFDPSYVGSLSAAVGGRPVVAVGQSGASLVVAVLDETAPTYVPFKSGDGYGEFVANVAWLRARVDFPGLATSEVVENLPHGRCCGTVHRVDERSYFVLNTDNFATSTIMDITAGPAVPGLVTRGIDTLQILRVR